ncbi:hypothetical protein L207DRAFT_284016 [Hyaloscypha variabilis F]|uniref:Uncharacterized protein n=1 Tax=Hyaloscypha variabilis (strain UAMH 11265 / GT02V1 / F) TaxID=1149755 RepID=A0A2J6S1I0_HYAVF|nr:hypothetical protein L207DRAFT_284016 [Hyaloscypha variabilis F]
MPWKLRIMLGSLRLDSVRGCGTATEVTCGLFHVTILSSRSHEFGLPGIHPRRLEGSAKFPALRRPMPRVSTNSLVVTFMSLAVTKHSVLCILQRRE